MALTKNSFLGRWRSTRDFQDRGVNWAYKKSSGSGNDTGKGATSRVDDESTLAMAGLLVDYRITLECECDNFSTAPVNRREIVLSDGPHAGRYQIMRVRPDELGALYYLDLGATGA